MQQTTTRLANRLAWVDLATTDAEAAREFYSKLFGWKLDVSDDPQYGGYATAQIGDQSVAGIGPKQSEDQPTVWSLYIGTDDVDQLARDVANAGGRVAAEPFDVGDQGRMAVFQDPTGAFISAWQGAQPGTFLFDKQNTLGWAELNARGVDKAILFYERIFGWTAKVTPGDDTSPPYTEFQIGGESICGAFEMNPQIPAEVPSYWLAYFNVDDVDAVAQKAAASGGRVIVEPQDYPGGRFAVLSDPQGATFGLLKHRGI